MLTCKDVCNSASDYLDSETTGYRRFSIWLHLMICRNCRRFIRQFRLATQAAASIGDAESDPTEAEIDELLRKLKA